MATIVTAILAATGDGGGRDLSRVGYILIGIAIGSVLRMCIARWRSKRGAKRAPLPPPEPTPTRQASQPGV